MSVHLSLTKTSGGYEVNVPISTQSFFMKTWLPLAEKKSLHYIEAMLSTPDLDQEFLINLIKELKIMKDYVSEIETLSKEESDSLIERISYILEEIEPEADYPDLAGWIG